MTKRKGENDKDDEVTLSSAAAPPLKKPVIESKNDSIDKDAENTKEKNHDNENAAIMESLQRLEKKANEKEKKPVLPSGSKSMADAYEAMDNFLSAKVEKKMAKNYDNSPLAQELAGKLKGVADLTGIPLAAKLIGSKAMDANEFREKMSSEAGEMRKAVVGGMQTKAAEKTGAAVVAMSKAPNSLATLGASAIKAAVSTVREHTKKNTEPTPETPLLGTPPESHI